MVHIYAPPLHVASGLNVSGLILFFPCDRNHQFEVCGLLVFCDSHENEPKCHCDIAKGRVGMNFLSPSPPDRCAHVAHCVTPALVDGPASEAAIASAASRATVTPSATRSYPPVHGRALATRSCARDTHHNPNISYRSHAITNSQQFFYRTIATEQSHSSQNGSQPGDSADHATQLHQLYRDAATQPPQIACCDRFANFLSQER